MNEILEILEEIQKEYCNPGQSPQINISISGGNRLTGAVFITEQVSIKPKFRPITVSHTSLNHHLFMIFDLEKPFEYFNDWKEYIK